MDSGNYCFLCADLLLGEVALAVNVPVVPYAGGHLAGKVVGFSFVCKHAICWFFFLLLFQGDPGFCGQGSFCMSSAK